MLNKNTIKAGDKVKLKKLPIFKHSRYGLRCHAPHGVDNKIYPTCIGEVKITISRLGFIMYIEYEDGREKFLATKTTDEDWVFNEDNYTYFKKIK